MNQQQYLKRFKEITEEMYKITEMKNKDYSGVGAEDAFANFRVVEEFGIKTEDGFITRILDKVKRISNLTRQDNFVQGEKITDTLLDAANYCILFLLYLESKNETEIDTKFKEGYIENYVYHNIEKKRKDEALQFLKDNGIDTPENRALINAVKFTPDAIEIGGVRWSYNNLKASDIGMHYSTDTKAQPKNYEEAHVFTGNPDFPKENYFTREAIRQIQEQGKAKIPTDMDMEHTLKALPGWTKRGSWEKGSATILSILLGTQMSGYRRWGERSNTSTFGYLWSASPFVSSTNDSWAFKRESYEGKLFNYNKRLAFPCRTIL